MLSNHLRRMVAMIVFGWYAAGYPSAVHAGSKLVQCTGFSSDTGVRVYENEKAFEPRTESLQWPDREPQIDGERLSNGMIKIQLNKIPYFIDRRDINCAIKRKTPIMPPENCSGAVEAGVHGAGGCRR